MINPKSLKKLTKEQKLLLIDLLQEKKRRLKDERDTYHPNEGQQMVHKCSKRERFVMSGNGAGKTALAVNEAIWAMQGYNPNWDEFTHVPAKVIVLLDSPEKVSEVWIPELMKWCNLNIEKQGQKQGTPHYRRINWSNGSYIQFMFHDQQPMKFESIEADVIIGDEPFPRHIYVALKRGLRRKHSNPKILLVGTPITGTWVRKEIYEPWAKGERPDVEFITFWTDVNKDNLADGYLDFFFGNLSEKEKKIRREGRFFDLDGLALAHLFDHSTHVIAISDLPWDYERYPCAIIMDPHPSKKQYAILMGVDERDNIYVIDEISEPFTARQFIIKIIKEKRWFDFRIMDIIYDSLGSAKNTSGEGFLSFGEVVNEELERYGYPRARATKWKEKNDEDFIERMRDVLAVPHQEEGRTSPLVPKLRVVEGCNGTISDMENVQWAKDKRRDMNKPKLDIEDKDFLACVKYGLASNLYYDKPRRQKVWRAKSLPPGYVGNRSIHDSKRAGFASRLKMSMNRRKR